MTFRQIVLRRASRFALAAACVGFLAACDQRSNDISARALSPIPNDTLALMAEKGVTRDAPVLLRAYKKEAELEIWKKRPDGQYVYLKTFPMCRWSGQLGPKLREGDRQVPEGFYSITPGQMNPNSHYFLSFNVGYPNAYDRSHGATGGDIMVHGICSSAGCFSMTNQEIAEIYAIAREAFNGGQRAIQMQSMPFKMTAENLAKHRLDPHIAFWKMLKEGVDHFEVTKQEPNVGVCGRRYVFDATPANGGRLDPEAPCPALSTDPQLAEAVAAKQRQDEIAVAALVAKGVRPVELVYNDGGQNPVFYNAKIDDVSRPEGLTSGPIEIALDDSGKPIKSPVVEMASKPAVRMASAAQTAPPAIRLAAYAPAPAASAAEQPFYTRWLGLGGEDTTTKVAVNEPASPQIADVPLPPPRPGSSRMVAAVTQQTSLPATAASQADTTPTASTDSQPFYERWLGLAPEAPPAQAAVPVAEPAVPQPSDVPLPPRRQARLSAPGPQASLTPSPYGGLPKIIVGSNEPLPAGFLAYSDLAR